MRTSPSRTRRSPATLLPPASRSHREQDLQKKLRIGGWIGFAVCMIPIFIYVTNADHFTQTDAAGLDQNIVALIAFIVPWTIAGLACLVITTVLQEKSILRETDAANAAIKAAKAAAAPSQAAAKAPAPLNSISPETARRRILLRRVLMAAAVLFIVLGIFNGSMKDVLIKAIKICTECVGLG